MRTALLAAVSHDLRSPLSSAKAAVTSLRSKEVSFHEQDRAELLATADESLDRLATLVANLLDMSRLQAGVLGVSLRPIGFEEAVPHALDEIGEAGCGVRMQIGASLPAVRADLGLLECILVVDDEPQILRALRINLRARDYDIETAVDGASALKAAAAYHPDLIVLDLGLPDVDGIEVIRGIRGWSDAPIIVLSGRAGSEDKVKALDRQSPGHRRTNR